MPKVLAARSCRLEWQNYAENTVFKRGFTLTFALADEAVRQLPGGVKLCVYRSYVGNSIFHHLTCSATMRSH